MNIKKSSFTIIVICAIIGGIAIGTIGPGLFGTLNIGWVSVEKSEYESLKEIEERYTKAEYLLTQTKEKYYKDVDEKDLESYMYKGIFEGLGDPYSSYLTKEEMEQWTMSLTGEYDGIGVTISANKKGEIEVVSVEDGSPAKKAGIRTGDVISAIDGESYDNIDEAASAIRGEAGTKVRLRIVRGNEKMNISVTRAHIKEKSVSSKIIEKDIGYIRVSTFNESTAEDFERALKRMENKDVKGLIIDMRGNGGGLVEEGRDIADMLQGKGVIAYTEDGQGERTYMRSDGERTKLTYVLLVNGSSASTTEIVAASVKDNEEGILVGTKTYGKGVIQETETLPDGSAFILTTMQYFSPDGHTIHEKGVVPDHTVKGKKAQLREAVDIINGASKNH